MGSMRSRIIPTMYMKWQADHEPKTAVQESIAEMAEYILK